MNQSSPYLLQILNQNHPSVHLIARERGKMEKKSPSVSVERFLICNTSNFLGITWSVP